MNGDYSLGELKTIKRGANAIRQDRRLMSKMEHFNDALPTTFSSGGPVIGPGTSTSDSVKARLSNGEYVINAASTQANKPLVQAINNSNGRRVSSDGGVINSMKVSNRQPRKEKITVVHNFGAIKGEINVKFPNNMMMQIGDELTKDPKFRAQLTQMVANNFVNIYDKGKNKESSSIYNKTAVFG